MVTLSTLERWLTAPAENERLEFKEAKVQYDTTKLMRYCVALANEGGGHLVLGVSNMPPRQDLVNGLFNRKPIAALLSVANAQEINHLGV